MSTPKEVEEFEARLDQLGQVIGPLLMRGEALRARQLLIAALELTHDLEERIGATPHSSFAALLRHAADYWEQAQPYLAQMQTKQETKQ